MKIMNQYIYIFQKENQHLILQKYGLTKSGGCILANNKSKIPSKELTEAIEKVSTEMNLEKEVMLEMLKKRLMEIKEQKQKQEDLEL